MKIVISFLLAILTCNSAWSGSNDLDKLLLDVKQRQILERKINRSREAKFLTEKQNQQQLLQAANAELHKQKKLSAQLKTQLESNEELLAKFAAQLKSRSGELGELFGVARQAAGDLKADLLHSMVSAQYPGRGEALDSLIESKALPTIDRLENLWLTLQHEMTESGKVVRFKQQIQSASGNRQEAEIIRIGAFNAIANGGYLRYSPETKVLTSLARQPEDRYLDLIDDFSHADSSPAPLGIDPTRGVMLSMLIQTPNTQERIQQGGVVGYIILMLGALGFIYAILRLFILANISKKMQQQMDSETASADNPLGRVLYATEQSSIEDTATLELILDEAITREVPKLEKGISMIKLFAAVAPLLGLLGTVTGMIATFQSISLFGTGDPKLMADGISQALVTTMLGLCVAIPLLFLHNLLSSRSKELVQILDEQSAGIMSRRAGK
ncbi:biopolymer transport protein ExbB [Bathymodiolus japonicus methanotrophic gill symbiont]|uniref:MotA/TolQ/ExbB proton channel family protein n=1 Tax=Bathymodiolus japonicus methanotrophic gill symbiont TaxID=113269 RepID=UPI001B6F4498|nr:MotA/TolQ/ExbB proton channel family protein [Bathymodiolus japonicus methanotrophic gill symbiont]GFO72518.1 biopolymer transport protein ExbB [Bathymodiolus japonicus methanotrophic gill symbiont]